MKTWSDSCFAILKTDREENLVVAVVPPVRIKPSTGSEDRWWVTGTPFNSGLSGRLYLQHSGLFVMDNQDGVCQQDIPGWVGSS